MQRYTIFFITVNALHVSGGFSVHHQELKNCTYSIWYMSSLLAATASGSSKQANKQPIPEYYITLQTSNIYQNIIELCKQASKQHIQEYYITLQASNIHQNII